MRGKHYDSNKKKNKILVHILLFVFISIMIFSGIKIFNWLQENKKSKEVIEDIQDKISINTELDTVERYNIDFDGLKLKNSDTIAWIKINGTDIEHPIVKTTNNEYYLTHSFDKSYNSAGWIFMDYQNKFDGTDNNIVIYGHNRRDSSMFGTLKNILTEEWQNNTNNFIIPLITEKEKAEYQVFSIYEIEKEDYYITTNFGTDNEFQNFIDKVKSRSIKNFGVQVNTDDKILTLSTCADNNQYRVVLHAKKIKK